MDHSARPQAQPLRANGDGGVHPDRRISARTAWLRALMLVAVLWVVLGVGCFGFGAQLVADRYGHSLRGAFVLDLIFLAGVLVVIAVVVGWQRAHDERIRDLGWRAPTRRTAIVIAIVYGLLWTASSYARGGNPLAWTWQRPVMAAIGLVLAFGEELAVRGFFMEQLRRGGIPTWVQVVSSGVFMGVYHGVLGRHVSLPYMVASAVIFGLVSVIFVIGRRSLTPGYLAHAMTHLLGDPALIQGIPVRRPEPVRAPPARGHVESGGAHTTAGGAGARPGPGAGVRPPGPLQPRRVRCLGRSVAYRLAVLGRAGSWVGRGHGDVAHLAGTDPA